MYFYITQGQDEITGEILKYFELNENEDMTSENLWEASAAWGTTQRRDTGGCPPALCPEPPPGSPLRPSPLRPPPPGPKGARGKNP